MTDAQLRSDKAAYARAHRAAHHEECLVRGAAYRKANREKLRAYAR